MAYKALYRKYRPQTFQEVYGQSHITSTLQNAVKENRIAHAYLFTGPRGTGKTTMAKLFAKAVNCEGETKPCGICSSCLAIQNGNHPDVIEIDAASNNGVDEIRDLIEKVKFAPIKGNYKVYIIDEVHMMSTGAFNALLKTLEEPPAHVIFILATTEPNKILPTVISRCQRFDFSKISLSDLKSQLEFIVNEENIEFQPEAIHLIARLAEGGMRDALSILEQCLAYTDSKLTYDDVSKVYGVASIQDKIKFILYLNNSDLENALQMIEEIDQKGIDVKRFTSDLIELLKDKIIYNSTQNLSILQTLSEEEIIEMNSISTKFALDAIDVFIDTLQKYKQSIDAQLYFELACLKIGTFDYNTKRIETDSIIPNRYQIGSEITANIEKNNELDTQKETNFEEYNQENIEDELQNSTINEISEEKTEEMVEDILTIEDEINEISDSDIMNILVQASKESLNIMIEKWPIIKRYMSNLLTAKAASIISSGIPVAACENGVIIKFEHSAMAKTINAKNNYYEIQSLLQEIFGKPIYFIGLEESDWIDARNQYLKLRSVQKLPKPKDIIIEEAKFVEEESELLNYAKSLFDDKIIKRNEE